MRITLFSFFLFLGFLAQAQIGGQSAYPFLNLVTAPRIAGTGGNGIANMEPDAVFGFYNPALLTPDVHGRMSFAYANMASDVNMGEFMYTHHVEKAKGTFLIGMKYYNYGKFLHTNTQAQILGDFTASDYLAQVGYGYTLNKNIAFGASLKFINSAYETYNSWGIAADLGATYQIPERRFAMAMVFKNIGYQFNTFAGERDNLPFEVQYSISNKFEHLPFRWMITFENLQKWDLTYNDPNAQTTDPITGETTVTEPGFGNMLMRHIVVGGELSPHDNFNIQIGYNFRRSMEMKPATRQSSAGFTFGLGFKIAKFRVNYANTYQHLSNRIHHVALTTSLDRWKKKSTPPNN
ncbi:MAG: type IX secretion system protein PorQ [Schleiferiaceae bacterium]|jgi:hypothetical protein|nr:type IX secretion system protein PorQ [Schleiferiaceae bacterium]